MYRVSHQVSTTVTHDALYVISVAARLVEARPRVHSDHHSAESERDDPFFSAIEHHGEYSVSGHAGLTRRSGAITSFNRRARRGDGPVNSARQQLPREPSHRY